MTDANELLYDFNGIDTIGATIKTFVADMQQRLDEVKSTFDGVRDIWSGAAAEAFEPCQKKWNQGAQEMGDTLTRLTAKVAQAAADMAAADKAAAAQFSA